MSDRKTLWRHASARNYAADLLASQAWKERQRKPCSRCGELKSYDNKGELCTRCLNADRRYWTADRIIDAIQRFAREHGRPPAAKEWMRKDWENDYPSASAVYGANSPFECWSDAIFAAGFPRPRAGYYQDESKRRAVRLKRAS